MTTTPGCPAAAPLPHAAEKPWQQRFFAWLIVALAPIGQMAIDIFVPALPLMAGQFAVERSSVQWSVTLYLAAFAAGHLVYGPLSDSWGRRRSLIAGLVSCHA